MEKIGIVAGTVAFLGLLLFCTWHHSVGSIARYSSDTLSVPAAIVPPVASTIVPPSSTVTESPLVSIFQTPLEAAPNASSRPPDSSSKEKPLPQLPMPPLRSKVVEFRAASHVLTPKGRRILDSLLPILRNNPKLYVEIAGHTDNLGVQDYNLVLSQQRAEAVRNYFIAQGIEKNLLGAQGYGASWPIADNTNAEGRHRNRRTEIIIHSPALGS
jgi:outer membrane protein OmpA-like peptidoglycan-associated protein